MASKLAALVPFAALAALAQDPFVVAPANYRVEFENEWVRVSRASLRPGDKLPVHNHPARPTVYVYLTDGGPIRFTHIQPSYVLVRKPVKAGAVRFNRNAHVETHVVEYLGDQPSEYLRVELKTEPGPPHRDARIAAGDDTPFEDSQVRISRVTCHAGQKCEPPSHPAVTVNISDRSAAWFEPGKPEGDSKVLAHEVRIELLSKPIH